MVDEDVDYVLLLGADHRLPLGYIETILKEMENNPNIVVASGRIEGEPYLENAPRGSGRIVNTRFWRDVNGLRYPVEWGWESWLFFKAMQMNREARCFRDIVTEVSRQTSLSKALFLGKGMYALGYHWRYALARILLTLWKSPRAGLLMFWGWIRHEGVRRLDVADWVAEMQGKTFWKRVWLFMKRGGRR